MDKDLDAVTKHATVDQLRAIGLEHCCSYFVIGGESNRLRSRGPKVRRFVRSEVPHRDPKDVISALQFGREDRTAERCVPIKTGKIVQRFQSETEKSLGTKCGRMRVVHQLGSMNEQLI